MSSMKRLIEDYPFLNRLRKVVEGHEPYPFQQVTAMDIKPEKRVAPKHNGRLDDYDAHDWRHASVQLQPDYTAMDESQRVVIYGYYAEGTSYISIDPKQALSLLEWLNQNREKLEELAKGREG